MDNFTPLKTKKKKKINKLLIVIGIFLISVLVLVSSLLVIRNKVGQKPKAAGGWCNADEAGHDYGNPCSTNDAKGCGGDGKQTICTNNTWHATGECCGGGLTPGAGSMSCESTTDPGSPDLKIFINNTTSDSRSYQLQRCSCPDASIPCRICDHSQPGLGAGQSTTETHSQSGNCGSVQLDVNPINEEFSPCYATYSTGVACTKPTHIPTPTTPTRNTPTPTRTPTPSPTPITSSTPTPTTPPDEPTNTPAPTATNTPTPTTPPGQPTNTPGPTATNTPGPTLTPTTGASTATPTEIILAKVSVSPTTVAKLLQTGVVKSFMYFIPIIIMLVGLIL